MAILHRQFFGLTRWLFAQPAQRRYQQHDKAELQSQCANDQRWSEANRAAEQAAKQRSNRGDFYAPLTRGGVAMLEGRPATGLIVLVEELAHNLYVRRKVRTVLAMVDAPGQPARELLAELRSGGVYGTTTVVTAHAHDSLACDEAPRTALAIANQLAAHGHETLVVIDERLMNRHAAHQLPRGFPRLTTLIWRMRERDEPAIPCMVEPDAVVVLRPELGRRTIWPAIDPLRSYSRLIDAGAGHQHRRAVVQIRDLLRQTGALDKHPAGDDRRAGRARRALVFQTQPFSVAEVVTARPGVYVDSYDTVAAFTAIADGAYDGVAESTLSYIGTPATPDN